jgi:hypothetical protein
MRTDVQTDRYDDATRLKISKFLISEWVSALLETLYTMWLVLQKLGEADLLTPSTDILPMKEKWRFLSHHLLGPLFRR